MEKWINVWRNGLAPLLSTTGMEALRQALARDDARLIQHATCNPPPSEIFEGEAVEGACALGFCAWQGDGMETVGQVEDFFIRTCTEADEALGEPAACRFFLNWFDDTPRLQMRRALLREINRTLNQRQPVAA
jgi:hypothetical protein